MTSLDGLSFQLYSARTLEPLALLYCIIAIQSGGWSLAWKLLRPKS